MKKTINKIRIKALKPIFATRNEVNRLNKTVNLVHSTVVDVYRSFYSDSKKKFDTLFNDNRTINDRLDYHLHLINRSRIMFSVISVLLAFSIIILSF